MRGFNHFGLIMAEYERQAALIVNKTAHDILAVSQPRVPVDTGALKNSGQVQDGSNDLEKIVAYTMEYAPFVEDGTVYMAAQPYLTPAAEEVRPAFTKAMKSIEPKV
jgi:HK97 gp10 family phage protein